MKLDKLSALQTKAATLPMIRWQGDLNASRQPTGALDADDALRLRVMRRNSEAVFLIHEPGELSSAGAFKNG